MNTEFATVKFPETTALLIAAARAVILREPQSVKLVITNTPKEAKG